MRVRHRPCPYITQRIKDLMINRDSLHRQFQLTRDIIDWRSYKHARQSVKNALKKAEKEYVRGEVLAHKNNAASLWKIINRSIPTKERSIQCYSKSPELIANEFNQFFVAVGEKTAIATTQLAMENNFDVSTTNPILIPTGYALHETFKLSPVSCTEVERIIISMPSNKSPGPDKVTMSVLKDCVPVVLGPITDIINCSFATSTFPDEWKLAEAIPVLKEGDHEVASNNRPLSLLNVVSKICERVVLNQFNSYLIRNNRLSAQQSGNKKQHSTETLNLLTTDHLLEAMDSKKLSALILIDLSKAFDSISHQILLKKLSDVGASQETVKWFESYLTGRVQQVRIGSSLSAALPITHGVPQGAILSPLLFCIYTNDLPTVTQTSELNSFVDDSKISLSFSIEEVLEAKHKLELDLRLVAEWCCKNALLINPGKTKFLLVGTRQLLNSLPQNMSLNFLNKTLEPVNFTNDLGMTLDCNLTYNKHVSQLTSACMAKLCQINRVKHCFDRNTLIYIICAVVMGKLYYCSTVWSNTTSSNIKKLQAVQNFACRIIVDGKKFDHITPVLRDIGWLPVKEHLLYRDMVMIYKCMNGLAPPYLADLFHKRSELNEYATRNSDSLHIPLFSTTTGQRSFRYRATKLWNSLDEELKKLPLATFKINLKRSMFNKYFER